MTLRDFCNACNIMFGTHEPRVEVDERVYHKQCVPADHTHEQVIGGRK